MNTIDSTPAVGSVACSLLLFLIAPVASRAELIASDDFEYDNPVIFGCDGGIGWADAWTGENSISRGSLRFPDYEAKGNRLTTVGDTAAGKSDRVKCSFRTLDASRHDRLAADGAFGKSGTTFWVAFVASVPRGWDIRGAFAGVSLFDERREQLFLGDCGSRDVWGFERIGELQGFSKVRADTNVTFLVYKIDFRPEGAQLEMWVNPKPGTDEPPAAGVAAAALVREFRFTRVRICSAPAPLDLDGLRIGTTYADVAPRAKKP